jgi:hypothetical protein
MKKKEDFIATVYEAVAMVEPQTERAELWLTQHFRPEELHTGFLLIEQSRLAELMQSILAAELSVFLLRHRPS